MVIGFITAYAIRAYHHQRCELESHSGAPVTTLYDKVCQWLATGPLFSPSIPVSSTKWNWSQRYSWNIVESGVKHHNPNPNPIKGSDILPLKSAMIIVYCRRNNVSTKKETDEQMRDLSHDEGTFYFTTPQTKSSSQSYDNNGRHVSS